MNQPSNKVAAATAAAAAKNETVNFDKIVMNAAAHGLNVSELAKARKQFETAESAALQKSIAYGRKLAAAATWFESAAAAAYFQEVGAALTKIEFIMLLTGRSRAQSYKLLNLAKASNEQIAEFIDAATNGDGAVSIDALNTFISDEESGKDKKAAAEISRAHIAFSCRVTDKNGKKYAVSMSHAAKFQTNMSAEQLSELISALQTCRGNMVKSAEHVAAAAAIKPQNEKRGKRGDKASLTAINEAAAADEAKAAALAALADMINEA